MGGDGSKDFEKAPARPGHFSEPYCGNVAPTGLLFCKALREVRSRRLFLPSVWFPSLTGMPTLLAAHLVPWISPIPSPPLPTHSSSSSTKDLAPRPPARLHNRSLRCDCVRHGCSGKTEVGFPRPAERGRRLPVFHGVAPRQKACAGHFTGMSGESGFGAGGKPSGEPSVARNGCFDGLGVCSAQGHGGELEPRSLSQGGSRMIFGTLTSESPRSVCIDCVASHTSVYMYTGV